MRKPTPKEVVVHLTRKQAILVLSNFEHLAKESCDKGYRRQADQIVRRMEKAIFKRTS